MTMLWVIPTPSTSRYGKVPPGISTSWNKLKKTRNNKRPTNRKFAAVSKIKDKSLNKTSNEHTWFDRWPFLLGNSSVLERYTRDCEQQTGGLAPPSRIKIMEHKLGHICCLFTFCFERGYLLIIFKIRVRSWSIWSWMSSIAEKAQGRLSIEALTLFDIHASLKLLNR